MASGEPARNSSHPPMIKLEDDCLSFTFPEIGTQLRAHVERQIGHILPEFLRPEGRTALLAELEARWGFRQLDGQAQDRHRLRVLTLTAEEIETALRTAALRAAGLRDASSPALTITFHRTLRIPDDGRTYPLPAGLGAFPLRSVDDFPATAPASWLQRGGVVMPMYQSEAPWISFSARYPFAVKLAAGKINAVSGAAWTAELHRAPQDYVVVPGQPWLDGFSVGAGLIRQFVARSASPVQKRRGQGEKPHGKKRRMNSVGAIGCGLCPLAANTSKCPSSVITKSAPAAMAQSANLSSSASATMSRKENDGSTWRTFPWSSSASSKMRATLVHTPVPA